MQLQLQTWQEIEAYLQTSRGIILPIGSTEQHGPSGLIGTDAICAEVIARGVGETAGALVGPTIAVGMAQHHLGFTGSMTLRPSTLIAVLKDMVDSLAVHGFERFYFLNGHGGNIATLAAAFSEIYATRSLGTAANTPTIKCRLKIGGRTRKCTIWRKSSMAILRAATPPRARSRSPNSPIRARSNQPFSTRR